MELRELASLVEKEVQDSIGHHTGDLADARALELKYYNSEAFGNEREGESQVVSSDVFDTVEGMLPGLLRIFTASDDVVRFDPQGPEDEEDAKQRTDLVNYVFYKQNQGFLILYEWFKDALIQKNGVVKYWWDDSRHTYNETYKSLTEGEFLKLMQGTYGKDTEIEVISHETYEDELAKKEKEKKLKQALQQISAQPLPPEQKQAFIQRITQEFSQIPVPNLHDVELKCTKNVSRVVVETIPPEEFRISKRQKCISIQNTLFCSHETRKTKSELREMGCPEEILASAGPTENVDNTSTEALARERFLDESNRQLPEADDSLIEIDVSDCFYRIDFNGDGISELRHIIKVGKEIWVNDECEHINFAALTPIIMPHKWVGKSAAELVMQDQFTKSTIWRQMLNNLYLTNNPRKRVLSTASGNVQANLDDLMNSRVGGIIREYVPNAVQNDETPFVAHQSFPMLEYIDAQKEARTGQTRYNQGTDADSLNKTARGIQMIQQAGQQRIELIARIFAETGVKDLIKGIEYTLSHYGDRSMTVRLRNNWVDIDPRDWKHQYDVTVNVGLGTGNTDNQLMHLAALGQSQLELMQTGRAHLVSDQNVYNLQRKKAEAMGFKHPELFITDPRHAPPPPQLPNPDVMKIQVGAQIDQAKIQSGEKVEVFRGQLEKEIESLKSQTQVTVAQIQAEATKQIEMLKCEHESRLRIFEENNENTRKAAEIEQKDRDTQTSASLKDKEINTKAATELARTQAEAQMSPDDTPETLMQKGQQQIDAAKKMKAEEQSKETKRKGELLDSVVKTVTQKDAELSQSLAQLSQGLAQIASLIAQQVQLASETNRILKSPKTQSISDVQFGADGIVKSARVTPTIN